MADCAPIFICGMHRSGTSLTANRLRRCGLWLGEEKLVHGATADNPDGHWENIGVTRVNDALLNELGGGWDHVPEFPASWAETFASRRERVKEIHAELARPTPWGWKDPRASLLLPFWLTLAPLARVVVCVRHPLEVADSLRRRGLMSHTLGLKLWRDYNERLLADVPRKQRIVVHYGEFFSQPAATLWRLADFCGLKISAGELEKISATVKPELRHTRFADELLEKVSVAPDIIALYDRLCGEAGHETVHQHAGSETGAPTKLLDLDAFDYEMSVMQWNGFVEKNTPPGARVSVVAKGDDNLLKFSQRGAEHFPRDERGRFAGYHPADDAEALRQLEFARRAGTQFLALPHGSLSWLKTYPKLAEALKRLPVAAENAHLGIIFRVDGA